MYVGENKSTKFWLSIMNDWKNRGVRDILIACGRQTYCGQTHSFEGSDDLEYTISVCAGILQRRIDQFRKYL